MFDLVARGTFRKIEQKSIILSDAKRKFLFVHCFLQYYIPSVCFAPNLDTMKNMSKIDKFLLESDMEKKLCFRRICIVKLSPLLLHGGFCLLLTYQLVQCNCFIWKLEWTNILLM